MRLIAKVIRISRATFHCSRLTTYKILKIMRVSFFGTWCRRALRYGELQCYIVRMVCVYKSGVMLYFPALADGRQCMKLEVGQTSTVISFYCEVDAEFITCCNSDCVKHREQSTGTVLLCHALFTSYDAMTDWQVIGLVTETIHFQLSCRIAMNRDAKRKPLDLQTTNSSPTVFLQTF